MQQLAAAAAAAAAAHHQHGVAGVAGVGGVADVGGVGEWRAPLIVEPAPLPEPDVWDAFHPHHPHQPHQPHATHAQHHHPHKRYVLTTSIDSFEYSLVGQPIGIRKLLSVMCCKIHPCIGILVQNFCFWFTIYIN